MLRFGVMARGVDSDMIEPEIETHPIPQKDLLERLGEKRKANGQRNNLRIENGGRKASCIGVGGII